LEAVQKMKEEEERREKFREEWLRSMRKEYEPHFDGFTRDSSPPRRPSTAGNTMRSSPKVGAGGSYEDHEAGWARFERRALSETGNIRLRDLPCPSARDIQDVGKRSAGFKKLALRWHPDKFIQKFGANLNMAEKESICTRVKEVFQEITNARTQ